MPQCLFSQIRWIRLKIRCRSSWESADGFSISDPIKLPRGSEFREFSWLMTSEKASDSAEFVARYRCAEFVRL
jgi:hypothetical protein